MSYGDRAGHAVTSSRAPRAFGVCDFCGWWYNLEDLKQNVDYYGPTLKWTGFLVCRRCNDNPQDQSRPIKLPPDPVPKRNPRPEFFVADQGLQGFTQYILYADPAAGIAASKADVLSQLAQATTVPTPLTDRSGSIAAASVTQTIMPVNGARTWMAIYNAASPQLEISLGVATWGAATNLVIGPGECLVASGSGNVSTGAITGIGLSAPAPFYAWDH